MRIMGLDASTTTIGIAIIDSDGYSHSLIHHSNYSPNQGKLLKELDILDMVTQSRNHIIAIAQKYNITNFVIEDYVRYMGGKSSAATIIPLAILNFSLRLAVLDNLDIIPKSLSVLQIRHALKKTKELPSKEDIPDLVASYLNMDFPWQYKESKKKNTAPKIDVVSYDMADAMAVALAWSKLSVTPKKKVAKKKK